MCGRYTLTAPEQLALRFDLNPDATPAVEARYNIAPSQPVPVIVAQPDGRLALEWMRWGFRPAWAGESRRPAPINARAETLLERPYFRSAMRQGRCLIPADGFFEWQVQPGRGAKHPMYIRLRDGGLFALAGLYARGPDGTDALGGTCAIITTSPNRLMEPIHDRMPAILDPDDEARWLDPDIAAPEVVRDCLRPYPAEAMVAYPVSTRVNAPQNEGAELIAPLAGRS
ncbi:MAG TPA: SOS response-associated peptidase [Chloroflexota bacterium]|nr:SOS response-associated peptidase [Chloroflexota bacterium]